MVKRTDFRPSNNRASGISDKDRETIKKRVPIEHRYTALYNKLHNASSDTERKKIKAEIKKLDKEAIGKYKKSETKR